ncbi:uncharacterized protein [Watersipora subatra]|uniref:uncharacterized protein isoform X1 n=1 Tax=Watersipora subatra TaxID=2589382 RepID=UPI00355B3C8B
MASESAVCGYCLEKDEQLVDPRSLPCHHVHCYPCLVGDFEANRIVRCGTCKAVFDVTLARLPPATKGVDNLHVCDTCLDNKTDEPAVSYCTTCSRKMCTKHLELHGQFFPLHRDVLDIKEYQNKAKMLKEQCCATHPDEPIVRGCSTCFGVLCVTCLECANGCIDGSSHSTIKLEKLLNLLKNKKDKVKAETWVKDGELSSLLKRSIRILSCYEKKTSELVDQLHNSRDTQLLELRRMYDELERELVDNRRTSKEQLVEFIEKDIGVRMTEMNTLLLLQDAKFKESHQVDIINSFTATYNEIRRFIDEDLPSLTLTNQKSLSVQANVQKPEVQMVDDSDIYVQLIRPPTSLKLMKAVPVNEPFYTVTRSDTFTYAGGSGPTIYRIDETDNSVTSLSSLEGEFIDGLCLYNERLYILVDLYKVLVTDLNGKLITSWVHYDSTSDYVNELVVTGDKVVVPDRSNKCLTVYSLDGQVIKQIPCSQDDEWETIALCAPDQQSAVVSSCETSTVLRVNIETGETVWTCTAVDNPGGVVCYKGEYILVTPLNSEQTEIHILQADTGRHLGKLIDSEERSGSRVYDICVSGDTLIIPRCDENTILYYQLM